MSWTAIETKKKIKKKYNIENTVALAKKPQGPSTQLLALHQYFSYF